jgi:hypothetical protein
MRTILFNYFASKQLNKSIIGVELSSALTLNLNLDNYKHKKTQLYQLGLICFFILIGFTKIRTFLSST